MPKEKAEKTKVQLAADAARKKLRAAKDAVKIKDNDVNKAALAKAQAEATEAIKLENRERFLRVGAKRAGAAGIAVGYVTAIFKSRSYSFTKEEGDKAIAHIQSKLDEAKAALADATSGKAATAKTGSGFAF